MLYPVRQVRHPCQTRDNNSNILPVKLDQEEDFCEGGDGGLVQGENLLGVGVRLVVRAQLGGGGLYGPRVTLNHWAIAVYKGPPQISHTHHLGAQA